ncbi:hypothetical protein ACHAXS_009608 [Conticribra weissflogii]
MMQMPPPIAIPPVPPEIYLHHTSLRPRPKLILIGDSITEQGSSHSQGWVTDLSIRYGRRVDVINRGMNGYNSRWGLACLPLILEEILGPPDSNHCNFDLGVSVRGHDRRNGSKLDEEQKKPQKKICQNSNEQIPMQQPRISHPQYTFLIGYGANDSCLADGAHSRHHVAVEEYSSNLKQMVELIQSWKDPSISDTIAVGLVTPPPCDTDIQSKSRDNENMTKLYAEECIKVANELGIPVVDLWNGMQLPIRDDDALRDEMIKKEEEAFVKNSKWKSVYLSDGLHLTPMGNYRMYQLVVEILDRPRDESDVCGNVPLSAVFGSGLGFGLKVTDLPRQYPDQKMVNAENPFATFGANNI